MTVHPRSMPILKKDKSGRSSEFGSYAVVFIHLNEDHEQTPEGNTREREGMEERDRHSSYDLKRRGPKEPLAAIDGFLDGSLRCMPFFPNSKTAVGPTREGNDSMRFYFQ